MTPMPCAAAFVLLAFAPAEAPKLALKHAKAEPPDALAEKVRKLLQAECEQVADADGNLVAEVWFRDSIPSRATADQVKNGLTYRELPEGVLLGAVRFSKPFVDFRKQDIPAGVYTLRFAIQPETGDHTGTAPHTEFALLSPAADDASDEPLEGKALQKLSAKTTGGDHPGVMLLFPNTDKPGEPRLKPQKDGVTTLELFRTVTAGDAQTKLGFALTVSGYSRLR
jgi:hypothetical protein